MRTIELIRARSLSGFDDQLQSDQPGRRRAGPVARIGARRPGDEQSAADARSVRVSALAARAQRRTPSCVRPPRVSSRARRRTARSCLQIARTRLGEADPLTLSTVLECFGTSRDEAVGEAVVAVLRKSPAALTTLGEDRLQRLLAGYPEKVRRDSEPLFQQLRDAQRERIEKLRKLEPLLTAGGDVGRGRRIFFGQKVACSSCHTIGAEGGHVGPDLTGVGAIRSGHDLLEAVVFPSASFVPGYEIYLVDIGNDRLSGVVRSQSRDAVVLVTGPHGEVRDPAQPDQVR